jgi:8-oxo-dGTP pyrophosphatase MutT (NUDIX family)
MTDPNSYLGRLRAFVGTRLLMLPSVRAICLDGNGRVLLQRRRDFGNWGLPGGSPEPAESVVDGIAREVMEETGLTIGRVRAIGFASDPATEVVVYPHGDRAHAFSLILLVEEWSGELRPTDPETLALDFFDPSDLPAMEPCQHRTVEAYLEYRRTGEFQLY